MKNIANILSEALAQSHLDEADFHTNIEGFYKITISSPKRIGRLFIYMGINEEEIEQIQYVNSLLSASEFVDFKNVLNSHMVPPQFQTS
jgi:hypothetical protein